MPREAQREDTERQRDVKHDGPGGLTLSRKSASFEGDKPAAAYSAATTEQKAETAAASGRRLFGTPVGSSYLFTPLVMPTNRIGLRAVLSHKPTTPADQPRGRETAVLLLTDCDVVGGPPSGDLVI